MNELIKFYLPIGLILYLLLIFIIPTYRIYKSTGINPISFGTSDNAHDYIGLVMKLLIGLLFLAGILYSIAPNIYPYLSPISYLENQIVIYIGLIILHISIVWIFIAQMQMGQSWRIGIDEKNKTELITSGLFSFSRNPIFFGMIWSMVGFFLLIPNALTFCLMITSYIVIQIQIRLEEEFLEKEFGENYLNYKSKTRRLI